MKPWLLKLHRWLALVFAAPLAVVVGTGLILSFEPWIAG
ncbi:MAG: PepSY domain-containing protein, partial [Hyphomicrobiaceae bacterium]